MPTRSELHLQAHDVHNPFDEPPPRISAYTAQEIATLQSRLERQLGPEYISTRQGPGGSKVHYLAAEKVINLANEVFGFNGWSSSIIKTDIDYVDQDKDGRIAMGISMIMRVTLRDGTFHEDIGYGEIKNCAGKGAAFEKTKKEAATDALKRALRNFGNVLGNCLYDKSYLAKITKVKAPPSNWSVDDLHRHPEFVARPTAGEVATEKATSLATSLARRTASEQSRASAGSTDYDDEFGGNLFEEADFMRPDEVVLEGNTDIDTSGSANVERRPEATTMQAKQSIQRAQSLPHPRPQPNTGQHPQPNQAQMLPPVQQHGQQRPNVPQNVNANNNGMGRGVPPTARMAAPPQMPSPDSPQKPQRPPPVQQKSTPEGMQHRPPPQQPNHVPAQQANQVNALGPEAPVGFVSGRAAEILQAPNAGLPNNYVFNPHIESPSIRKTNGFNHRKSGPVRREDVGAPLPPVPAAQPPGQQNIAAPAFTSAGATSLPPISRPNFINPQADTGRRIGMPPQMGMQSPGPPRGAGGYKMPGPAVGMKRGPVDAATRPPLGDVSNVTNGNGNAVGDAAGLEVKRMRVGD